MGVKMLPGTNVREQGNYPWRALKRLSGKNRKNVGRAAGRRGPSMMSQYVKGNCRPERIAKLPVGHLLGHIEYEFAIFFFHFAQQAAKLVEKACIFTGTTPRDVIRRFPLGKIRQLRRFFTVIKELIEWALESTRKLFQRFNGGDGMTILNAGNVTTKQTCAFFDVALGEFLFFAQSAKTVTNNHGGYYPT